MSASLGEGRGHLIVARSSQGPDIDTIPVTLTVTTTANLKCPINLQSAFFQTVGGSWITRREPTQTYTPTSVKTSVNLHTLILVLPNTKISRKTVKVKQLRSINCPIRFIFCQFTSGREEQVQIKGCFT